jgi:uncharacterized protein (DUF169 family)
MTALKEFNQYGEELEKILILRTSPVAVKMLEKEEDIPAGAVRPKRDRHCHIAQCQAFALSRREKTMVAMLKEDHWCPAALMAYGLVDSPSSSKSHPYDRFKAGKYLGILTAPLKTAIFKPDAVIIYSNTAQLRSLLLSMSLEKLPLVNGRFFPPSCAHAVVNPILTGQYWVVIPDPGEYQRALTGEDEIMFALPGEKMEDLVTGLIEGQKKEFAYSSHNMFMQADFPHADFYKKMFRSWGLEVKE